jgi:two-component system, cell cycle response regulator DivK
MSKRILVVEDQEDNRQIVRDLLTANNYEMTEAENGEEALAAVAKDRPDLILMDIQLPVMDGYEATRRIKADPSLSSIPIIAVTSYALSGDEEKARAAGCNDFVPKPYSPRQLLGKIRRYYHSDRFQPLALGCLPLRSLFISGYGTGLPIRDDCFYGEFWRETEPRSRIILALMGLPLSKHEATTDRPIKAW